MITWISIVGVTVGTAALVIALSLNAGFVQDMRERIYRGSQHLSILAGDGSAFAGYDAIVESVGEVEGVAAAGPVSYSIAMLSHQALGVTEWCEMLGVAPGPHAAVVRDPSWTEDPFAALDRPTASGRDAIVVGSELGSDLGVLPGDTIRVFVPSTTLSPMGPVPRSRSFEVVALYASGIHEQDARRSYVRLDALQGMLREKGEAAWIELRLDDLDELDAVKSRVESKLGPGWYVIDLLEQNEHFLRALNLEKVALFLAIGLIVVVASLNIVSTLILTVNEKIREIGTLSALGAAPRAIALVFILQGVAVGAVGIALGLPLGWFTASTLDRLEWPALDPDVYYLDHVPFLVQPTDVLVVGVAALLIALFATIYPAWRAARLDPVEAIRHD